MNNKTINLILISGSVAVLIAIAVLAGTIGGQKNNDNETSVYSNGALTIKENNYDFGTISMANGDVSYRFKLKNEGDEAVAVKKVYTSCMCTIANILDAFEKKLGVFGMPGHGGASSNANIEIKAGESIIVEAVFNPAAHGPSGVGLAQRSIYLETNSKKSPKVELNFTATVTQ